MFNKLLDVLKYNIEEQNAIDKQELRAKKKSIPITSYFTATKVKKGNRKFTMADLEAYLEEKKQTQLQDKRLISFFEIYMNKEESQQREAQARSSIYDAASPKESDASITPLSAMGGSRPKGFFREQPTSTKNLGSIGVSLDAKKMGINKPTTPRLMPGLDMDKLE